ncbi:methanobactin export MATE transporter MbnM [Oleiphilus messinensis]|nr:methanobactin export MATE transporter MbnM [Oleiphilus messinensis]
MLYSRLIFALLGTVLLTACSGGSKTSFDAPEVSSTGYPWPVPSNIPLPIEPEDNPMSEEKFQLGRHLFYDNRLSGNGSQSCASCHHQDKAFTDGLTVSVGSTGQKLARNAQSLINVAYNATLTWANPSLSTLEQQAIIPIFGEDPVEQGINDENRERILAEFAADSDYQKLFQAAFPTQADPVSYANIVKGIASFVRGIITFNSPADRFERGDASALTPAAQRGRTLFFSESLECFHCHGGYNFSDSTLDSATTFVERPFHNTGLFNINGTGDFPEDNTGIFEITGDPGDMGKFRAVSLRNIADTAPYMHDGSINTLDDVIDFYAAGGRVIETGALAGDGRLNPFKDGFVSGFQITQGEKADLIAFLQSLSDPEIKRSPRFANPHTSTQPQ